MIIIKKSGKKKWQKTLIICPARKNSEKRHKKENITTSISNKKGLPGTSAKIRVWQFGQTFQKRWERSTHWERWQRSRTCQTFLTFTSYIYRYFANRQLFFLIVNTFIHWIFNVMFNPAYHHCHLFTDFYKKFTCVELKPLLIARKSDTPIFWRACLLVVLAGFNPRTYSIRTLQLSIYRNNQIFITTESDRFSAFMGM